MVAMLVMGALVAVGRMSPMLPQAAAQTAGVTIKTSADSHDNKFFGGALQVVITDPEKDDSDVIEEIQVDVEGKNSAGDSVTNTFTISETSKSSNKFEFYLAHEGSDVAFGDIDSINSAGVANYPVGGTEAPFITFGATGDLTADIGLYEEDSQFTITYQDETKDIDYDDTDGKLTVDRASETYGSDSIVHLFINDQDANLDPTNAEDYTVSADDISTLISLVGGEFTGSVLFEETGDNTGKFEADITLNEDNEGNNNELHWTSETVQLTLHDMVNYAAVIDTDVNDKTGTSDVSISIDNENGEISTIGDVTFASELKFTVTDNDQNRDSEIKDTIPGAIKVTTDSGELETYDLKETAIDSSIFQLDTTDNEVKITFLSDGDDAADNNGKLEMAPGDTTEDVTITYTDPVDDNDDTNTPFTQTVTMTLATPSVTLPDTAGINDDFKVQITDGNLNDNPRTKDAYTIKFDDSTVNDDNPDEFNLQRGGDDIGDWATIEIEIQGEHPDFTLGVTETLTETGVNTGIFEASFDMATLLADTDTADNIDDGDQIKITFHDNFDDQTHEASDTLHIGKASEAVDFSRTVLPIPPTDADTGVGDAIGIHSVTTLLVTDPDQNQESSTEDHIDWCFEQEACADDSPSFRVEVDADGTANDATVDDHDSFVDSILSDILPDLEAVKLDETGKTTGVFDQDLEFEHGSLSTNDWQDLEITITEIQTDGDEEEAGVTFRGNDGVVTVDKDSLKNGDVMTITVQDEDLNLDDDTAEEFTSGHDTTDPYLLSIETEDDDVCGDLGKCPTSETFRETGKDTGIFTGSFEIGDDIPVTGEDGQDIKQASNLHITYNDEVDSSGSSGDEIEIDVPVVTSTGAISVQPELVGPGTSITVTVTDTDLNKDASGTDTFTPDEPNTDNFFVNFRSDRDEVNEASPKLEETGPNTGVFQFTIDLTTDANDCADDDLSASKYEAHGGSNPTIGACPGDIISVRYEDEQSANGHSTVVSKAVEVKSFDPEFATDKESYGVGEKITLTISDPDANHDPDISDSLTDVRVFSDSDVVGETVSALETGKDTGVFKLSFSTSADSNSGSITAKKGDDVTVQYTDEFPANFVDTEDDHKFKFVIQIGTSEGTINTTTPTAPAVKDTQGKTLASVQTGQQVVLSTTVVNNNNDDTPFVAIVEVRDNSGVTTYLAWQTGSLNADGRAEVGLSWTPDQAGSYQVRTFVISDLGKPAILSPVVTSTVTVT